jgi:tRNA G37 N-methylase Trm5
MFNASEEAHRLLREAVQTGDLVVDATMGNGHDTVYLAKLGARVVSFDIQPHAFANTAQNLQENGLKAELHVMGHERLKEVVKEPVRAAIFNLGYLPGSDKRLQTRPETTIAALEALVDLLEVHGRIVLVLYRGHDAGQEADEIIAWAGHLSKTHWQSLLTDIINHEAASVLCLEKLR